MGYLLHGGPYCDFSRGFFLILFSRLKSEDAMGKSGGGEGGGGGIVILGCRIAYKGAMDRARGGKYYILKFRWSTGKICTLATRVWA